MSTHPDLRTFRAGQESCDDTGRPSYSVHSGDGLDWVAGTPDDIGLTWVQMSG